MRHALVTGMSATGKSTVVLDLQQRGVDAVDLDDPRWSHEVQDDSPFADGPGATEWTWRDDAVGDLLAGSAGPLVVAGASSSQGGHDRWFGHVVLLSVPTEVAAHRLATRTTNTYGKAPDELARELRLRAMVEPLLRRTACCEVDTSVLERAAVAQAVLAHLRQAPCRDRRADARGPH